MGSNDSTKSTIVKSLQQGLPGKLNVILHGLFAFDQEEDGIVAYIPNLGSEHVYKAGKWLVETNLEEHAKLSLEGVTPNGSKENRILKDNNFVLGDVPVSASATDCHCIYATIKLPYPPSPIASLRRQIIPADAVGGDDKKKVVVTQELKSATVQVLTYDFTSDAELRLGDHPWEPVLQPVLQGVNSVNYVNLHVFSEPERNSSDEHLRHSFRACVGLFVGVDLTLKGLAKPPDLDAERGLIPPGVDELELQDLAQRKRWLEALSHAIKDGRNVNSIWDDPTPFASSDACTGCAASDS
jgi:hypothetical protein